MQKKLEENDSSLSLKFEMTEANMSCGQSSRCRLSEAREVLRCLEKTAMKTNDLKHPSAMRCETNCLQITTLKIVGESVQPLV